MFNGELNRRVDGLEERISRLERELLKLRQDGARYLGALMHHLGLEFYEPKPSPRIAVRKQVKRREARSR